MRKVCIITGTRAEYGLFKPILTAIKGDPDLEYQLIVTGMHLSEEFGNTVQAIKDDGFEIHSELEVLNKEDSGAGMASYIGKLTAELSGTLNDSIPDILLLLGDRGEQLGGAITGVCMNIPVLHLHGGETTGSVDDLFRNAITKLAHLHLPASENSKKALLDMGEDPDRIYVVGAPGLDEITNDLPSSEELARSIGIDLSKPLCLFIQHPVTTEMEKAGEQIRASLEAIVDTGIQTILIYPNADPGGRIMIQVIKEFKRDYPDLIQTRKSLSRKKYLGLMNVTSVMVGNSSSGIIEAPAFKLPVINIGTRQLGREKAANVIDVVNEKEAIEMAIDKALNDSQFRSILEGVVSPYGDGHATDRTIKIIKEMEYDADFLQKR